MKWVVDPGLEGDFYADKPYLYGGLGGSVNSLYIGDNSSSASDELEEGKEGEGRESEGDGEEEGTGKIVTEGGTEQGMGIRAENGIPDSEAGRKKFFLNDSNKKAWVWEGGREYGCDFFNPYLDFNGKLLSFLFSFLDLDLEEIVTGWRLGEVLVVKNRFRVWDEKAVE